MPPRITVDQMKDYSLHLFKAVLVTCGTQILDLAKTNLRCRTNLTRLKL